MGSSTSKVARKLPTKVPSLPPHVPDGLKARSPLKELEAAASPPGSTAPGREDRNGGDEQRNFLYGEKSGRDKGQRDASHLAFSGEKDDEILRDSMDPQFLANLSTLGPVHIHEAGQSINAPAQRTLMAREAKFTNPTAVAPPGYLSAASLTTLLDQLKTLPPGADPSNLYRQYTVSASRMSVIRKWVNSPSVGETDEVRVVEGNEIVEMKAIWVDPRDEGATKI